jgi:hypothetical protein
MTCPCTHTWQFKEMLQTAKALPAGNLPKPLEVQVLKWFYMSFHKTTITSLLQRARNVRPRPLSLSLSFLKPSSTGTRTTVCSNPRSLRTLKHMELKHIKKHAHLKFKSELHDKICTRKDKRHTNQAKRELASRDTQCHPNDCREERRWYINRNRDCNCAYVDKRQAAKCPHIKHSGNCNRKDNCRDNQPKKLGYEKPKSNSKVPCPIHSFRTNRQSTHGPTAPRSRPTRRSRPCKARWTYTTLQLIIATSVTMTAGRWSRTTWRLMTTKASTVACPETTMTPSSPSWLLLLLRTRKWQRRSKVVISQPRRRGRLLLPLTTMARTWRMPSLPQPLPKASKSPWLSLWKAIDGTCQWSVT